MQNVLASRFEKDLIYDLHDSETGYSLLLDETNDISVIKLLGIVIRNYSKSKREIVMTYLQLVELSECTADAIAKTLKECLLNKGLELTKLQATGTDNAYAKVGTNNGVYARLKAEVRNLQLIR